MASPHRTNYLVSLIIVMLLSMLFPTRTSFPYRFEKGTRWQYNDLYAPFDFPVAKSAGDLDMDRQELHAQFPPVCEYRPEVAARQLVYLDSLSRTTTLPLQPDQWNTLENWLAQCYKNKILGPIDRKLEPGDIIQVAQGKRMYPITRSQTMNWEECRLLILDSMKAQGWVDSSRVLEVLNNLVLPDLVYSKVLTTSLLEQQYGALTPFRQVINKEELVISKGSLITEDNYLKLTSLRNVYNSNPQQLRSNWINWLGNLLLLILIFGVYIAYLRFRAPVAISRSRHLLFLLMWVVVFACLMYITSHNNEFDPLLLPFCIVPIIVRIFFNVQVAVFTHITVILVASITGNQGLSFGAIQLLAGVVAVLVDIEIRDWGLFFRNIFYLLLIYVLGYMGFTLLQEGQWNAIEASSIGWLVVNALLTMLAYPLVPALEKVFGFYSAISLQELADLNKPLLRELSLKAPGTFQHSLAVATLCESAAQRIHANTLLIKVGALYHDVGKILTPQFFIENRKGGDPHLHMEDHQSAQAIIAHVPEGIKLARKHGVPEIVIDFIRTHHGNTRVEYFYQNWLKSQPGGVVDDSQFRYPGPRPRSREEAVLMLADTIEAAARSLKEPSVDQLEELVDRMVDLKIKDGQLDQSTLTFRDLQLCRQEFKKVLKSTYHARVPYPETES